jgi:hypothetical protein
MKRREIKDTYIIGHDAKEVNVKHITIMGNRIYAVSPQLLYSALLSDPLSDYSYWQTQALPTGKEVSAFCAYDELLYMVRDNVLCSYRDTQWQKHTTSYKVNGLCPTDQHLFILPKNQAGVAIAETDLSLQMTDMGMITDIVQDGSSYWWASVSSELVRGADRQAFRPDGPINNIAYRMRTFGDRLYVVPGGRWATQNKTPGEIMFYENGTWTNISNAQLNEATGTTILDLMNVAQDPNDKNHYFVTSYGTGLLEMYDDDVINFVVFN